MLLDVNNTIENTENLFDENVERTVILSTQVVTEISYEEEIRKDTEIACSTSSNLKISSNNETTKHNSKKIAKKIE